MWIKTKNGDYYNMDLCREIFLDYSGENTYFRFEGVSIGVPGDIRDKVIKNIMWGTRVLEVE